MNQARPFPITKRQAWEAYKRVKANDRKLVLWATRKYKHLRNHRRRASHWLERIVRRQTGLFAHWRLLYGQAG